MSIELAIANKKLYEKYDVKTSYYTSYPPSGLWSDSMTKTDYKNVLQKTFANGANPPLQLYIHFPFCKQQCLYCQCFQIVSHDQAVIDRFVDHMFREIDLLFAFFTEMEIAPNFNEVHFGGGSPSYLDEDRFSLLTRKLKEYIDLDNIDEVAIEIDPRTVDSEKINYYHSCGVNRISFGIQDINPDVQKAINRVQPLALIEKLLEARTLFKGVNFDLIYGLPRQTRETLQDTLKTIIRLSPDRIAFSILGHRPDIFKHNRRIKSSELPGLFDKVLMWEDSCGMLTENGYERIGMDHFAKAGDELCKAKNSKKLFRNSMGYSPGRFEYNIAIGPSGMSRIGNYYFQNIYFLEEYYGAINNAQFPILRGWNLKKNDVIRRTIMNQIMTYYHVNFRFIEEKYGIVFNEYFEKELMRLKAFAEDGLIIISEDGFQATELGNYFFLRHICEVFDDLNKAYQHNIESGLAN